MGEDEKFSVIMEQSIAIRQCSTIYASKQIRIPKSITKSFFAYTAKYKICQTLWYKSKCRFYKSASHINITPYVKTSEPNWTKSYP